MIGTFRGEHERRYGYSYPEREVELVTLRLRARMKAGNSVTASVGASKSSRLALRKATVIFDGKKVPVAVYERDGMQINQRFRGPAIVTEYSATTVVPPRKTFWIDRPGNLVIGI
jgi:N-methylhydantoinase A